MTHEVAIRVNGALARETVPDRLTLADYLRDRLGLTGTKLGCEQGVCGACTVLLDGASVRSCLILAAQADESDVVTVEGLTAAAPAGRELQEAFARHDAVQCGFCTPGFLAAGVELLAREHLDEAVVRAALSGNLCRCTGYGGIVAALLEVHQRHGGVPLAEQGPTDRSSRSMSSPEDGHANGRNWRRWMTAVVVLGAVLAGLRLLLGRRRHARMEGTA